MPLFQHLNFLEFHTQQQSYSTQLRLLSQLYLTRCRDSLTVASSTLNSWLSPLRSLASSATHPTQPELSSSAFTDKIYSLLTTNSTASYTTLAATVLALIFFLTRHLMSSYRDSAFYESRGGRHSPYTSYLQSQTRNISDYVEYLAGNDTYDRPSEPRYEKDYHRHSVARPHHATQYEPEDAPDVLLLRHRGVTYELRFVPFAIAEGKLYIQDIRFFAAEKLRTDPRRLKLLYKRRELTEDSFQAKEYGLKQNSEVTCVIIDPSASGSGDSQSSSDDDSGSTVSNNRNHGRSTNRPRRQRPRGQSTARHRSEVDIPFVAPPAEYLHPNSAGAGIPRQSRPVERSSGDSLNIPNGTDRHNRAPSRSRQPSPGPPHHTYPTATYTQPPPPQPQATAQPQSYPQRPSPPPTSTASSNIDPSTPLGKLTALLNAFHTTWLPLCNKFINSPPSDPSARDKEYKKLSESVLAQVVLKADNVETNGDPECRTVRRRVVNEANEVMKKLDFIGKRSA